MVMDNFIYLHAYSAYSLLQSGMTVYDYLLALKKMGAKVAGLSDIHFVYGQPHFFQVANELGIKPLLGVDLRYQELLLTIYPKNEVGYRDLVALMEKLQGNLLEDAAFKALAKNFIVIINSRQEPFTSNYQANPKLIRDTFKRYALLIDDLYIGLECYLPKDDYAQFIRDFATTYDYPLVAFPHVKYIKAEDEINLLLSEAISKDLQLGERRSQSGPYHLYTLDELQGIYLESELKLTTQIASKIDFNLNQKRGTLLKFSTLDQMSSKDYLASLCQASLKRLQLTNFDYLNRLEYELKVINDMGFNDYFLIVNDFVQYAKSNHILVGPGRGSAAGSLVAFLLGITTIDPLAYDLLFERFLNPARQTMPDIDIDFMDVRRDEVVQYLKSKYGRDRICNIVTFQTNAARASIRDIGRIYQINPQHINLLTKSLGVSTQNLRESYKANQAFKKLVDSDKYYLDIVALASKIEGFPRQVGMHAAGLILNDLPLSTCLPTFINNDIHLTQYEMEYLEGQGFLKMDLLGLTNLTTIDNCLALIKESKGIDLVYETLPFDEPEVYSLIASGQTMGIFQLESAGMLRAIRQINPSEFNDIVAVLALFRPGPMDNIPLYAERKATGVTIPYLDKGFETILAPTYGIIVYQEQIMQIVRHMAGFSYAEADLFRRAISKKDEKKLNQLKSDFIRGAENKHYQKHDAEQVFTTIQKFADYGFNKSHSVAYAKLACQMAYLKVHYPLEFYASILERMTNNDPKFPQIIAEIKERNLKILLPNINLSTRGFTPLSDGLRMPLSQIKGISVDKADKVLQQRSQYGAYPSFQAFLTRANFLDLSKNDLALLIEGGALDDFGHSRATMLSQVPNLGLYKNYSLDGQTNFLSPIMITAISDDPLVKINREIELLGLAVSDNPLTYYQAKVNRLGLSKISQMNKGNPQIYGVIKALKTIKTKRGDQMAFLTLSDYENEMELTIFPEVYAKYFNQLAINKIVGIKGQYQLREDKPQILVTDIINLEEHV